MHSELLSRVSGRLLREERGAVTAEFAIVLPVVVAVLGLVIGGTVLAAHRITLVSQASELARTEARGDMRLARSVEAQLSDDVTVEREQRGPLHCVVLRSAPVGGLLRAVEARAESCAALVGGAS
ncbi:TadE/TadG family type IV pilus assembly protein [Leucobacter chromiireducens]|uniref:TadE/TadG family type IV pilus assembly protein n=1 Tax=Leucobacter chromiireducens TaxID=283877 RepID=UPI000F642772|nr:TadE family protein [Leucobacter chromiireducens]